MFNEKPLSHVLEEGHLDITGVINQLLKPNFIVELCTCIALFPPQKWYVSNFQEPLYQTGRIGVMWVTTGFYHKDNNAMYQSNSPFIPSNARCLPAKPTLPGLRSDAAFLQLHQALRVLGLRVSQHLLLQSKRKCISTSTLMTT